MPRINFEESVWSDARFIRLCIKLGDEKQAIGHLVTAWRLAQKHWCPNKLNIPETEWTTAGLGEELLDVGLASRRDGGIYVSGSESQFSWWFNRQEAGRLGGLKRAARRAESSSAKQSQAELSVAKQTQANSSKLNPLTLTLKTEENTLSCADAHKAAQIERIVAAYPRRGPGQGTGKPAAIKKLERLSATDLDRFEQAVRNYARQMAAESKAGTEFVKMLSSFASPNTWAEWVDRPASNTPKLKSVEEALKELKIANGEESEST